MTIDLNFTLSLVMLLILFLGLLLACKVTSFNATAASLAVVTVITFIVGLIPLLVVLLRL